MKSVPLKFWFYYCLLAKLIENQPFCLFLLVRQNSDVIKKGRWLIWKWELIRTFFILVSCEIFLTFLWFLRFIKRRKILLSVASALSDTSVKLAGTNKQNQTKSI